MAATELEVLLNPLTMIESGGAGIVVSRVGSPDRNAITACSVELMVEQEEVRSAENPIRSVTAVVENVEETVSSCGGRREQR